MMSEERELITSSEEASVSQATVDDDDELSLKGSRSDEEVLLVKERKVEYTREFLLSIAQQEICKELPSEIDQSIISELEDATSGEQSSDSTGEIFERWDHKKLSTKDTRSKSSDEMGCEFVIGGKTSCDRNKQSAVECTSGDPWGQNASQVRRSWENPGNTSSWRCSSTIPLHVGILRTECSSKQSVDKDEAASPSHQGADRGLLTRCSDPYRPPSYYKKMSLSGTQNQESNNSETSGGEGECGKERAVDRRWRKASFDLMGNEKVKGIDVKQSSSLDDHKENSNPDAIPKESSSVPISTSSNNQLLCTAAPGSVETPSSTCEAADKHVMKESAAHQAPDKHVPAQQLSSGSQLVKLDSDLVYYPDKLQELFPEGGRFAALLDLGGAENIDPNSVNQGKLASNSISGNTKDAAVGKVECDTQKKKESRLFAASLAKRKEDSPMGLLPVSTVRMTTLESVSVDHSNGFINSVKPPYKAANLVSAPSHHKDKHIGTSDKSNAPLIRPPNHSATKTMPLDGPMTEIWQSSACTMHNDTIVGAKNSRRSESKFDHLFSDGNTTDINTILGGKNSRRSTSRFVHLFSNSDNPTNSNSSWGDKHVKKVNRASTMSSVEESYPNEGQPNGTSYDVAKASISIRKTDGPDSHNTWPVVGNNEFRSRKHHSWEPQLDKTAGEVGAIQSAAGSERKSFCDSGEEISSNLEIQLPDEDSLIAIDDTFILQQDVTSPSLNVSSRGKKVVSSCSGPNKLMGLENFHQIQSLQDPWLQESQVNDAELYINPLDSQAHLEASPEFHDPWDTYNYLFDPLVDDILPPRFQQLSVEPPQKFSEPVQHHLSPPVLQDHNFFSHLDNAPSFPGLPAFHQVHNVPNCSQEFSLFSSPISYQTSRSSTNAAGKALSEGRNQLAFNHLIQMQIRLAKMNLEAVTGPEQRASGKPISNQFC